MRKNFNPRTSQSFPQLSQNEQTAMLIITGITNFSCLPALYTVYHRKMYFPFFIGLFTCLTSFMYHSLESIQMNHFYLEKGNWHKLDNIGSIVCFQGLSVYWMDNLEYRKNRYYSTHSTNIDLQLGYFGLFLTMIVQSNHAWKIENTLIPILFYFFLFLGSLLLGRRPRFNMHYLKRGVLLMVIAVCCFVKGLDEHNDYLRFFHGLWHCFMGIGSFYLWQSIDKDRADSREIYKMEKHPRFHFFEVLGNMLRFRSADGILDPHKLS